MVCSPDAPGLLQPAALIEARIARQTYTGWLLASVGSIGVRSYPRPTGRDPIGVDVPLGTVEVETTLDEHRKPWHLVGVLLGTPRLEALGLFRRQGFRGFLALSLVLPRSALRGFVSAGFFT